MQKAFQTGASIALTFAVFSGELNAKYKKTLTH
jgi:hypothetical protein